MYKIGIDVGSTFTKYCVMKNESIQSLSMEKTPVRQREYFEKRLLLLEKEYPHASVISCGYGKRNVVERETVNELTALARGSYHITGYSGAVLDVGGQDTKIIIHEKGRLKEFFINEKCAAGSGMFLADTIGRLGVKFQDIDLSEIDGTPMALVSNCAVFAQSEIVDWVADNRTEKEIVTAVIWQIFVKAKALLSKTAPATVVLSGGLSQIKGIAFFAEKALGCKCCIAKYGTYLAAIGCALGA